VNPSPLQPFLDRLMKRSALNEAQQDAILTLPGRIEQVDANRDFVRLGERTEHACLIIAGIAAKFGQTFDGRRQITAIHLRGDMADLHSVVAPKATSALQALSAATVMYVPHTALRDVAARHQALAEAFWRDCVADASIASEWILNLAVRQAQTRTAHLFCELAARYGVVGNGRSISFPFPVTQERLGEALGLTSVHVNRTVKALRDAEIMDVRHRRVDIPYWEHARRYATFNPDYLQLGPSPEKKPLTIVT
jgi:CRP-like cAMP-binding protein